MDALRFRLMVKTLLTPMSSPLKSQRRVTWEGTWDRCGWDRAEGGTGNKNTSDKKGERRPRNVMQLILCGRKKNRRFDAGGSVNYSRCPREGEGKGTLGRMRKPIKGNQNWAELFTRGSLEAEVGAEGDSIAAQKGELMEKTANTKKKRKLRLSVGTRAATWGDCGKIDTSSNVVLKGGC